MKTNQKMDGLLSQKRQDLKKKGVLKAAEMEVTGIIPPKGTSGPRRLIRGYGDKAFLCMNSNSYLGLSSDKELLEAEAAASETFGVGPGAVRFISGTQAPHIELEKKLAAFHSRQAAMIFSSAYAAVLGVITPLIDKDTVILSDELNHNCIINAVRLSRPKEKAVYHHLDMTDLEKKINEATGKGKHLFIVTDGIFSMRGDHAPLDRISEIVGRHDSKFDQGITIMVDDSHGVGAFGDTGRGTEEYTHADRIDLIVATLGKALGVNGGYVVGSAPVVDFLRQTAPFYIYSNPITAGEAAAASKALDVLNSDRGRRLLKNLKNLTKRLEKGLVALGYETIPGDHPVVPLMVRDTDKTTKLVRHLVENGILATGLNYPVVPKGDEEIRFQVSAAHTEDDIDYLLETLEKYL